MAYPFEINNLTAPAGSVRVVYQVITLMLIKGRKGSEGSGPEKHWPRGHAVRSLNRYDPNLWVCHIVRASSTLSGLPRRHHLYSD
ncbi:MAG: hypothetical protein JJU13_19215 [Balneolaceae bacterium]|nr:hypothetical protein [Balneolaceae bacterium]